MQCAILRLKEAENEASAVLENRHLKNHCESFFAISKTGQLGEFINYLHLTGYEEQDQLQNPTIIDHEGKKVVFTSFDYLKEEKTLPDDKIRSWESNKTSSYPTIYFYDLDEDCVDWRIDGAEIFVGIDAHKNVMIVTNEIWYLISEETYKAKLVPGFSRH